MLQNLTNFKKLFITFSTNYKIVYEKDRIMLTKEISISGTDYHITLTDQLINQVNNLKSLYSAAYEDPESFEQVSSEISTAINEIAAQAEPPVSDDDLDKFIQDIINVVDKKAAEIEELEGKSTKPKKETNPEKHSKSKK